eukprot:Phypoly_transcript_04017.p1 GENE.Phypoly_transcript_04017~~Phypoly_transcript_04017.p1  ORF type:complete len:751 (+),score=114.83 Phypoly_transcript_04017:100-2253(+)
MDILHQVFAVFVKKMKIASRDRRFMIFGLVFPLLGAVATVIVQHQLAPSTSPVQTPINFQLSSTIPYITSPGIDPSFLFPYFPAGCNFTQFTSIDSLNTALLTNPSYNTSNIVGGYNFVNISGTTYTVSVWYNDSYHLSLPALTKTLTQAIYAYQSNASVNIQEAAVELPSYLPSAIDISFIAPTILQYGVMFLLPYFAINAVIEKEKQLKDVALLNSLSRNAYWIGTCLGDTVLYWIPNLASFILMAAFKVSLFYGHNAGPALLIIFLTGWCGIPFIYLVSCLFDKEETANRWIYSSISLLSAVPIALTAIFGAKHPQIIDLMSFIPPYGYYRGLSDLGNGNSIFRPCILLFVASFVYWAIFLLIDYKIIAKMFKGKTPAFTRQQEDDDVARERESVMRPTEGHSDAIMTVNEVVKSYDSKFVAVKGVSFRIRSGECFGLLGPNGAGKTSILGVMYGSTTGDSGSVQFHISHKKMIQGVCPQFDVLWDLMTGKEHLQFYARVKGLRGAEIDKSVAESLELFGLTEYANQKTVGYSGGTKRKLCSAIALLADPDVVFMDEPSTGMDPVTRRLLWNVIEQKKHDRALILTTHSMEEAEALCTRVGIMVKGQLRCLGSPQHLRNKYGSGYRLTINAPPEKSEQIKSYVNSKYTARSQMAIGGILNFDITQDSLELYKIFADMEEMKESLGIEDYCLSQTSLEQVFLRFALEQEDEVEEL